MLFSNGTDQWALVMRTEIANQVMALATIFFDGFASSPEKQQNLVARITETGGFLKTSLLSTTTNTNNQNSTIVIRTSKRLRKAQFWLGVAALSLIPDPEWLEMSGAWRQLKVGFFYIFNKLNLQKIFY